VVEGKVVEMCLEQAEVLYRIFRGSIILDRDFGGVEYSAVRE
jgi:hypothetical protein